MKDGAPPHLAKISSKCGGAPSVMANFCLSDKAASPVTLVLYPPPSNGENRCLSIEY